MRSGTCYRKVNEENLVCDMPVIGGPTFKKANCCCSAFAQAWGSPCEICPPKNSGKLYMIIIHTFFLSRKNNSADLSRVSS